MARSYTRPKRGRKNTLLVQEKPVTAAVSTNSLYCLPAKKTVASSTSETNILVKSSNHIMALGSGTGQTIVENVVRCSSILLSSKSPFQVLVMNASGGYTLYECPGQKVVRLTLSRETSYAGNAALFNNASTSAVLVKLCANEDAVDIRYNFVVDSTLDE